MTAYSGAPQPLDSRYASGYIMYTPRIPLYGMCVINTRISLLRRPCVPLKALYGPPRLQRRHFHSFNLISSAQEIKTPSLPTTLRFIPQYFYGEPHHVHPPGFSRGLKPQRGELNSIPSIVRSLI